MGWNTFCVTVQVSAKLLLLGCHCCKKQSLDDLWKNWEYDVIFKQEV